MKQHINENDIRAIIRKKNERFLMTKSKVTRLKRRLRKIKWSQKQVKEWELNRNKLFKWN
jgi:hypothetical protein